ANSEPVTGIQIGARGAAQELLDSPFDGTRGPDRSNGNVEGDNEVVGLGSPSCRHSGYASETPTKSVSMSAGSGRDGAAAARPRRSSASEVLISPSALTLWQPRVRHGVSSYPGQAGSRFLLAKSGSGSSGGRGTP
ncbi:unnamed protein product, partial [Discosporangium mesarthrocarpum]